MTVNEHQETSGSVTMLHAGKQRSVGSMSVRGKR